MANIADLTATLKADVSNFKSGIAQAKSQTSELGSTMKKTGNVMIGVAAAAGTAMAVLGIKTGKAAVEMAASFEQSRIAFTTLLGSVEEADIALKRIEKSAKITPFNLPDLIRANQLLISAGVSAKDADKTILDLGDAISATGGGTAELNRLAVNLQQIKAVGQASALDIKQFAFAGINIYQMLADVTGKSVEQIRDMDISYEMLTDAFDKANDEGMMFNEAMEAQSHTLVGLKSNLEDVVGITLKDIAMQSGLFDAVKTATGAILEFVEANKEQLIEVVSNVVRVMGEWVDETIPKVVKAIDWLKQNMDTILPIVRNVVLAFAGLAALSGIVAIVGLLTNPISLVVIAIGAWVTALTLLWELFEGAFVYIEGALIRAENSWHTFTRNIGKFVEETVNSIVGKFTELSNTVGSIIGGVVTFFSDNLTILKENLAEWEESFGYVFGFMTSKAFEWADDTNAKISQWWTDTKAGFELLVEDVSVAMGNFYIQFGENWKLFWEGLGIWVKEGLKSADDFITDFVVGVYEGFRSLDGGITDAVVSASDAWSNFTKGLSNWLRNFPWEVRGAMADVKIAITEGLAGAGLGVNSGIRGVGSSILSSIKSFTSGFGAGFNQFADGVQNFSGGLALVGERGPELVNLPKGSDVIPNGQFGGNSINIQNAIIREEADIRSLSRYIGFELRSNPTT